VICVAFIFNHDENWFGGLNYLRNLMNAVYALPDRQVEVVIFTHSQTPDKYFNGFPSVRIVRSKFFKQGSLPMQIRRIVKYLLKRDLVFDWLCRKHGVSVLSHSDWVRGSAVPSIGWIPDFQHMHLPEYFSKEEIARRSDHFKNICRYCSTVIVSSHNARDDLLAFEPACAGKSRVLQFVIDPLITGADLPDKTDLEERYGFSGKYFFLPNQFWKHKNHRVVIEALGLLVQSGRRIQVLATGNPNDYRHQGYYETLKELARELGVSDSFRHFGIVPHTDLEALMLNSVAVINPSYFEGWSTTVEEAKAFGKVILLSDIPVHREQNPERGRYFQPDDANTLALLMWETWSAESSAQENIMEQARRSAEKRKEKFAREYQRIVLDTVEGKS
jgi:glycosyltransferase involved in cell wall biosynthesis